MANVLLLKLNADGNIAETKIDSLVVEFGGTPNHVVTRDASGGLSSVSFLPIVRGGTNSAAALSNNRIMISSGGAIVESAAITSSHVLFANSSGLPVGDSNFYYGPATRVLSVSSGFFDARDNTGLRLYELGVNGLNKITITSPTSLPADYSIQLPDSRGTRYQFMQAASGGTEANTFVSYTTHPVITDHFMATSVNAAVGFAWLITNTNGGVSASGNPFVARNNGLGYVSLGTGAANNATGISVMGWQQQANAFLPNVNNFHISTSVFWPVIATAAVDYAVRIGFATSSTSASPVDGVYFEHQRVINTAFWTCVTRSASVSTTINTTVPIVAGQQYVFEIRWNPGSVNFYIDGQLVGTSTTTIPTVATCFRYVISKTGTPATVSSVMGIDYTQFRFMPI